MDKHFLLRVEKTLKEIKRVLLLNKKIRTLLVHDSKAWEEGEPEIPTIQLAKDNIFLQPIIDSDIEPPFNKKVYISITLTASGFSNQLDIVADHAIKVSIMVHKTNWLYSNENIRALHIMQEVINELHGLRLACSNALEYEQTLQTIVDETMTGYSVLFGVIDGLGSTEEEQNAF